MRYLIIFGLLVVAMIFVALEIWMRPEMLLQTKNSISTDSTEEIIKEKPSPIIEVEAPKPIELKPIDFFSQFANMQSNGIELKNGHQISSLFQHLVLNPETDKLVLYTWEIWLNQKKIGNVAQVFTPTTSSVTNTFLQLKKRLQAAILNKPNITLSALHRTRGEANFYLNDKTNFPQTIFMVSRSGQKILAFSYAKKYHEPQCDTSGNCQGGELKNLIPLFFDNN